MRGIESSTRRAGEDDELHGDPTDVPYRDPPTVGLGA